MIEKGIQTSNKVTYDILPIYFDLDKGFHKLEDMLNLHGEVGYSVASTTYIANGCILVLMQRDSNQWIDTV